MIPPAASQAPTQYRHGGAEPFRFRAAAGGRVGGAAKYPVATTRTYPPNFVAPSGFVVGVIDTGIVLRDGQPHPWLAGHLGNGPIDPDPLITEDGLLGSFDGHGTFVAGLILREAPAATIDMVGILDDKGEVDDSAVESALRGLRDRGAKLINLSFSGDTWREAEPPAGISAALQELDRDVVVVASAGNSGGSLGAWPAALSLGDDHATVVGVGALDETRPAATGAAPGRAAFSNYGAWVDAWAAGVDLLGPYGWFQESRSAENRPPQHLTGWALWSGTSFAAATVTGVIANVAIQNGVSAREAWELVRNGPRILAESGDDGRAAGGSGGDGGDGGGDGNGATVPRPYVRGVASSWPQLAWR